MADTIEVCHLKWTKHLYFRDPKWQIPSKAGAIGATTIRPRILVSPITVWIQPVQHVLHTPERDTIVLRIGDTCEIEYTQVFEAVHIIQCP